MGTRLAQSWATENGAVLAPELRAAWMHEFLSPSSTFNAVSRRSVGELPPGIEFGRDGALLGGGTQYVLNQNVSLFANYDLLLNAQQAWNAGSGGVQVAW